MKKVLIAYFSTSGKTAQMADYVAKMDRAGIERSLLVAVRAGDMRVNHSFAIPYEPAGATA